jgi:hypothetical protein
VRNRHAQLARWRADFFCVPSQRRSDHERVTRAWSLDTSKSAAESRTVRVTTVGMPQTVTAEELRLECMFPKAPPLLKTKGKR